MSIIRCPNCRGKLIHYTAILNKFDNSVIYHIFYCPSVRCKIRKVIYDKDYNVLHVYYYKDVKTKRKVISGILKSNWNKYDCKTKKRLKNKYVNLIYKK